MVAAVLRSPTRLPHLPGVTFRTQPPSRLGLPRLDVAAFVGFAERGPRDLPVPVEDLAGFTAIFGGDVALAQVMEQPTLRDRREETIAVVGGSQARPGGGET